MTDFRALCVNLVDCLEKADWPPRYRNVFEQWASIARAALAEPADGPAVPEGREPASVVEDPSDEELIDFQNEWFQSGRTEIDVTEFQRATLARWGNLKAGLTSPPAEGEMAELVLMLHHAGDALRLHGVSGTAKACDRAAELLGRNVAPVPLPAPQGGEVE